MSNGVAAWTYDIENRLVKAWWAEQQRPCFKTVKFLFDAKLEYAHSSTAESVPGQPSDSSVKSKLARGLGEPL
jgi:hypothetical protein